MTRLRKTMLEELERRNHSAGTTRRYLLLRINDEAGSAFLTDCDQDTWGKRSVFLLEADQ